MDGELVEFVVGRCTLPYTIESRGSVWRGVSVLSFKRYYFVDSISTVGKEGWLWLWIYARGGKVISCYLVDYLRSSTIGTPFGEIPLVMETSGRVTFLK